MIARENIEIKVKEECMGMCKNFVVPALVVS